MEKFKSVLYFPHIFRSIIFIVESIRHRTCISDTIQRSDHESWNKLRGTFFTDIKNIQRRLYRMEKIELLRRMDEKIQENVRKYNIMKEKNEKTREEIYSSASFEWVKTDRAGDICKFKNFKIENDCEYVIFTDNTRIKTSFIGDIVLLHSNEEDILISNFLTPNVDMQKKPESTIKPESKNVESQKQELHNPIHALLSKAKLEQREINIKIRVNLPSKQFYDVITESFENGNTEVVKFISTQISGDTILSSLEHAIKEKYDELSAQ